MRKVFLGGTCNQSTWRDVLIPALRIDFFNPLLAEWTEEAKKQEIIERETADYCLYVITARIKGVYSIAEIIEDSNKRPEKTVFCFSDYDGEFDETMKNSLKAVGELAEKNGATWCKDFKEIADFLNKNAPVLH